MAYIQPLFSAVNLPLVDDEYIQPPASATNFDFATQASLIQYSRVPDIVVAVGTPWDPQPVGQAVERVAPFETAEQLDGLRGITSNQASAVVEPEKHLLFGRSLQRDLHKAAVWERANPFHRNLRSPYDMPEIKDIDGLAGLWETASVILDRYRSAPFTITTPFRDRALTSWFFSSDLVGELWRREENLPAPLGLVAQGVANLEFADVRRIYRVSDFELGHPFAPHPIQPKDVQYVKRFGVGAEADILKHLPWGPAGSRDTTLEFPYPQYPGPIEFPGTFTIPTLGFYVVANSAQIVRVSDSMDVPAKAVTLTASVDNYGWGFTATLSRRAAIELVRGSEGEPVEVDVHVNGNVWRIVVDLWQESRTFRSGDVQIQGRSRSAYLADPYMPAQDYVESSGLLMQQLAAQELPPSWSMEWNAADWFVPGDVWRYQALTPMDAIARLAAAAGGFVHTDPLTDKLIVDRLYPAPPWELVNIGPDIQIPRDVMVQTSSRKVPGSGANGVYVFGGSVAAYHGDVIRRLTNGQPRAPTVVNPLVTDRNGAEALGIVALAEKGRQSEESYSIPVSASLGGVVPLGALIEVGKDVSGTFLPDWRGLVRGVTVGVAATRAGNGGVKLQVRQSVNLIRHFNEPV